MNRTHRAQIGCGLKSAREIAGDLENHYETISPRDLQHQLQWLHKKLTGLEKLAKEDLGEEEWKRLTQ